MKRSLYVSLCSLLLIGGLIEDATGDIFGFLYSRVFTEPATWMLLASGFGVLGWRTTPKRLGMLGAYTAFLLLLVIPAQTYANTVVQLTSGGGCFAFPVDPPFCNWSATGPDTQFQTIDGAPTSFLGLYRPDRDNIVLVSGQQILGPSSLTYQGKTYNDGGGTLQVDTPGLLLPAITSDLFSLLPRCFSAERGTTIPCLPFSLPMRLIIDAFFIAEPEKVSLTLQADGHLNGTFYQDFGVWDISPGVVRQFDTPFLTISIEAVPEPSTWVLLLTGSLILISRHKYRASRSRMHQGKSLRVWAQCAKSGIAGKAGI